MTGLPPSIEHHDPVDDDFSKAITNVADEMDSRRTWRERLRDGWISFRLLLALLRQKEKR